MTDFHNNIFYYYRGAKQRESDRDKQLEDNFTKALINTLSHAGGAVRKQFLEWLGVPVREDDTVRFEMQRATIGGARIARKKKRILLALLPVYAHFEPSVCASAESSGDSRPDAWIYGDEFVVLIESKVVPGIDEAQMNTHFGKLAVTLQVRCHKFSVPVARNLTRTFSLPPSGNLPFTEAEGLSPVGPERSGGDAQRLDKSVSGGVLFRRKGGRIVTLNAICTVTGRATQHWRERASLPPSIRNDSGPMSTRDL